MGLKEEADKLKNSLSGASEETGNLYDQLRGVTSEIKGQATSISKSRDAFRAFEKGAQALKNQYEGINNLSDDQVKKLNEQLSTQRAIATQEAKRLVNEKNVASQLSQIEDLMKGENLTLEEQNNLRLEMVQNMENLTAEEKAILSAHLDNFDVLQSINDEVAEEVKHREKVNSAMGVAGGILEGLNKVGGSFASAFKLDKVAKDMKDFADQSIRANGAVSRLSTLGVGLKSAFSSAFKTLTDPSIIIAGAIKGFKEVDKASVEFQRQTGENLNTFGTGIDAANTHFITTADYIKTASALTKELGVNATAMFKPEDILEASEMVHAMGMSVEQSNKLALISKVNGGNLKAQNEAIVAGVNASNKQNKTAMAAGEVMKDVANVSDSIAIIYAGYPEKLGAAATTAKSLGMNLSDVDKIADSLLNFEQSISAELEAELYTGKELNLEKARQAALNNDLETVAKELANQGITASEFARYGRIEQEKYAKAAGMSKDQMAKMLILEQAKTDVGKEALTDAQKQTLENLKQEEAGEKFNKSIEKIQQALAPVVGFFASIATSVLGFLTSTYLIYPILGVIALSYVGKMVKGFKSMKDDMVDMGKDAMKIAKNLFGKSDKVKDVTKDAQGRFRDAKGRFAKAPEGADKAGESIGKSADKTKSVKGDRGKEIKNFLKGLGDGLKHIGKNAVEVMKGGAALLIATPGLIGLALASPGLALLAMVPGKGIEFALKGLAQGIIAFGKKPGEILKGAAVMGAVGLVLGGSFALAMMMIKDVDPAQMIAFSASLTMLGITMAILGNIGGNIIMGAAAMGILALSLIPAAFAFSLLAGVDVGSMIAFSIALPLLALAAAGLGFIAPFIMAGAAALVVLGLSLIPAGMAFGMITGLDTKAIMSFSTGVAALALTVAGLGFLAPFIIYGSFALMTLGLALIPLSTAFGLLASVDTSSMIGGFVELASLAPGLTATAAALFAVAGGMTAVAVAGYLAVPAMALMSLFGGSGDGGEGKQEDEMVKMNKKLDRLIAVVEAGGDVFIDGTKVGKTIALASSKMG